MLLAAAAGGSSGASLYQVNSSGGIAPRLGKRNSQCRSLRENKLAGAIEFHRLHFSGQPEIEELVGVSEDAARTSRHATVAEINHERHSRCVLFVVACSRAW